jgi:hypothetical protein
VEQIKASSGAVNGLCLDVPFCFVFFFFWELEQLVHPGHVYLRDLRRVWRKKENIVFKLERRHLFRNVPWEKRNF